VVGGCAFWALYWPHSRIGKRIILQPDVERAKFSPVQVGQLGQAVSDLRPMGICDFDGERLESQCDCGTVPAGSVVKVVNVEGRRPIVRPA
jgi:membrane-bound serine protease (ClpP class)